MILKRIFHLQLQHNINSYRKGGICISTQTKGIHLYIRPTNYKLEKLKQLKQAYKKQINLFTEKLINNPKYYDIIFDNCSKVTKAGKLEKKHRRKKLGSAYGQQALGQAVRNLSELFRTIRNKFYGQYINRDKYLYFVSSRYLFKCCITDKSIKATIKGFKKITEDNPNSFRKEILEMLEDSSDTELKDIKKQISFHFKEELKARKTPYQKYVTINLDSRTCNLEKSSNITAPYVLEVKVLGWGNKIELPLLTSTNSLRRLEQYKASTSAPQLKVLNDGKVKVTVAVNKKVNQYAYKSKVVGIDVGITDLIYTSEGDSFESYSNMDDIYQETVGEKLKNRSNLANKMKEYQKELQNQLTSQKRKEYLREKIYNISRNLEGKNQLKRLRRSYYHKVDKKISQAIKAIVNKYKDKKVTIAIEDLDIIEFDNDSSTNRKFSSWIRGKLLDKLKEELAWYGIAYREVEPAYTSQVCPKCYNLASDNREGKAFECTVCNHKGDADQVAANNIKARAFNQEVRNITKKYRYSIAKRQQKLREYYHEKHKVWLQENPDFQKAQQLKLAI